MFIERMSKGQNILSIELYINKKKGPLISVDKSLLLFGCIINVGVSEKKSDAPTFHFLKKVEHG
jgi:ABC-type uncharacterized transport system substrate-binding protein